VETEIQVAQDQQLSLTEFVYDFLRRTKLSLK